MGYCSVRRRMERDSRLLYFFGKNTAEVVPLTSATARAIWTTLIQFCLNGNDSRWRAVSSKWDLVCTVCPFVCFHIRRRTCKTCPYESTLYSWQEFCFPICAFATVKMNEFKLTDIKAGLGLSISGFEKLGRAGREEVEREGLATKTSATTSIWMILPRLCRKSYSWVWQETLRA